MLITPEELIARSIKPLRDDKDFFTRCAVITSAEFEKNPKNYEYGIKPYLIIDKTNSYIKLVYLNQVSIDSIRPEEDHCDFFLLLKKVAH